MKPRGCFPLAWILHLRPGVPSISLERAYKLAITFLATFIFLSTLLFIARATVYKIHAYERGLHLRGGRFISVDQPGWHVQIPLVDTVIIVRVNERLGYIERIPAMTSDDVTMVVSLQYTYRVIDPKRFALDVSDPERILFEFVQGKLRDVVNTKTMAEVMHSREALNRELLTVLQEKAAQYGVEFVTVQIQNASPPDEVLQAIKDRMVAVQRQEQAQAEAAQKRTLADAEYYAAQKRADAEAYQISRIAQADAQRITLTSQAKKEAIRAILAELENKGPLAEKYLDYLMTQELKNNSKWIISSGGMTSVELKP